MALKDMLDPQKMLNLMTGGMTWRSMLRMLLKFLAFVAPGLLAIGLSILMFSLLAGIISIPLLVMPIIGVPLAGLAAIGILALTGITLYLMLGQFDVFNKIDNIPFLMDEDMKVYNKLANEWSGERVEVTHREEGVSEDIHQAIILPDCTYTAADTSNTYKNEDFVTVFKLASEDWQPGLNQSQLSIIQSKNPSLLNTNGNQLKDGVFTLNQSGIYRRYNNEYQLHNKSVDNGKLVYAISQMLLHAALPDNKRIELAEVSSQFEQVFNEVTMNLRDNYGIVLILPAKQPTNNFTFNP